METKVSNHEVNVIVACTDEYGIGYKGTLPWNCKEELKLFQEITDGHILIVGRVTAQSLPHLPNRMVFCISSKRCVLEGNNASIFKSIIDSIEFAKNNFPEKKVFIAGGAGIYDEVLGDAERYKVNRVYLSVIHTPGIKIVCDRFIRDDFSQWFLDSQQEYGSFTHKVLIPSYETEPDEFSYNFLLGHILQHGSTRIGRNGETKSVFSYSLSFDLRKGFPLLTTKKMFFRGIVEELLFFLRGETDTKKLEEKGITIWNGNTNREFLDSLKMTTRREGLMGPMYGYQWRNFNAPYNEATGRPAEKGLDQLQEVINTIRNDPTSRRILLTDFNPLQAKQGVLYPCHSIIMQFYVDTEEKALDLICFNRSQDAFLGVPFNIASTALFLMIIAKVTDLIPRRMHINMGDVHIYKEHYKLAEEQSKRNLFIPPTVTIKKELNSIEDIEALQYTDFELNNYKSHAAMKAEMKA